VSARQPVSGPDHDPADRGDESGELVVAPWRVQSAANLVALAFALTLLAGALIAQTPGLDWNRLSSTLAVGAVLFALYATLVGIVWRVSATRGVRFVDAVGLRHTAGLRWYAAALGVAVVCWFFSEAFTTALTVLGVNVAREDIALFRVLPAGPAGVALTVVLLVVVAPFAEEIVFRGVLLSSLSSRWGTSVGLFASGAVFAAVHVSPVGFVPLLLAGTLFGWIFVRSRSLAVAILAHAAYNALGVVALFVSRPPGL